MVNMPSPVKLTSILLLAWIAGTAIAPFSFDIEYKAYPTILILGITLFFFIGALTTRLLLTPHTPSQKYAVNTTLKRWRHSKKSKKLLWVILLVAATGCSIRAYDRLFVRGLLYADSVTDARLALVELGESSGITSAAAGILFSFSYATFFLGRALWPKLTKVEKLLVSCISLYPIIEGLAQGGIIAGATASLYYYFVHKTLQTEQQATDKKKLRSRKRSRLLTLVIASIITASVSVYVERVTHMYGDISLLMELSEANGTIQYSQNAYKLVESFGAIGFIPIWLLHYFTLGIHELYYLINNFNTDSYFFGQYQLYIAIKFAKLFGLFHEVNLSQFYFANPMPGHYQTFWGPAYMDFGPLFLIEATLAGAIATYTHHKCRMGRTIGIIVYPYLMVFIILGFLANGLVGERLYFLFGLLAFAYAARKTLK
jgi:hypothetical protein